MNSAWFASLLEHYHWLMSLYVALGLVGVSLVVRQVQALSATFRDADRLNDESFREKMQQPHYAANMKWNMRWAPIFMLVIFVAILPFCLTLDAQPWWQVPLDAVVILMAYDFVYYLTHRFLFHDSAFLGGPLKWMHAVHHRQHNPCRRDSSYIHPLEVAIGLGLFIGTIFVLSRFMGNFHVVTIVFAWFVFGQVNVQNHALWTVDRAPFKFWSYASRMHHNHHKRFTGGNFATITLLFDWMFGTLDNGDGYGKAAKRRQDAVLRE